MMRIARHSIFQGRAVRISKCGYHLTAMPWLLRAWRVSTVPSFGTRMIYDQFRAIQGKHVPICLSSIDLVLPHQYDSGIYARFMFLSWAGRRPCLTAFIRATGPASSTQSPRLTKKRMSDADSGDLMVVDFERAGFGGRQPLGSLSPNGFNRKRKRGMSQRQGKDDFAKELEHAMEKVSRCIEG